MKDFLKMSCMFVFMIAVLTGLTWIATGNELALTKYFSPKFEQVRRETFEQTKSYNDGMIQELQSFQFQYVQASPEHKEALKSIILHRVANFDMNKLPLDLRQFIDSLKQN